MSEVLSDHLYGAAVPLSAPPADAPTHAVMARTLVESQRLGSLASLRSGGQPFASVVQYVVDLSGWPVLFVSALAEHTKNLLRDGRACLLVATPVRQGDDPMALPRVSVLGPCEPVPQGDVAGLRDRFVAAHPTVAAYVSFGDFAFWRLRPDEIRFVGGYGRMSWVTPDDFADAVVDPLGFAADGIVAHMNDDHGDACVTFARVLGGFADADSARLTAVDRLGMEMLAVTPSGLQPLRINFDEPQTDAAGVRRAVVALLARARRAGFRSV
jgi:hypothetical protein